MLISYLSLLFPILIIIAIVLAVRARGNTPDKHEGFSVARHVWLYLLTAISLGIFAGGAGQLLTLVFDITIKHSYLVSIGTKPFNLENLALGLALTFIGGPLWFLFWNSARKRIMQNPREADSGIRKLFLALVLTVTALTFLANASGFFQWVLAGAKVKYFSSANLATIIVAGAIWFYHWHLSKREGFNTPGAKTLKRWYIYILSAFGLIWLVSGLILFFSSLCSSLPIWRDSFISLSIWNDAVVSSLSQAISGFIAWYFHWFRLAKDDIRSTLRQVYFYPFAIAGGAILTLVSVTVLFYNVLTFIFGAVSGNTLEHFQFLGWVIPAIAAGLMVWIYHHHLSQEESIGLEEKHGSAQRVYLYLMNFLALGTTVAGIIFFSGLVIELIINALSISLTPAPGWWQKQLAASLALIATGVPLLIFYWKNALKRSLDEKLLEWRALSRRIFLYSVVGIAIVALAASLVNVIYQLINGALSSSTFVNILRESRWSLQTVFAASPVLWYFWQVLRSDLQLGAEDAFSTKDVTLVAYDPEKRVAKMLETALGYKIRVLQAEALPGAPVLAIEAPEIESLAEEIKQGKHERFLVAEVHGKLHLLPYTE
jgi:ABC-type multidrug transport system fused ATPase/permease subunit